MKKRILKRVGIAILALIILVNMIDATCKINIPVENANSLIWDKDSYWAYPWGESIVHKGVDIFGDLVIRN